MTSSAHQLDRVLPTAVVSKRLRRVRGFTLLETTIALTIAAFGLAVTLTSLTRASDHSRAAGAALKTDDLARGALGGLVGELSETSIAQVDTMMRVHTSVSINDVASDRFTIPGVTLKQCSSTTCGYCTSTGGVVDPVKLSCGFERRWTGVGTSTIRGKVVPSTVTTCPYDGTTLTATAQLDGLRFFTPRNSSGTLMTHADGTVSWRAASFVFPCVSDDGLCELRRYQVFMDDILAAPSDYSNGWSLFSATAPEMTDLWDFGTDGTTNGVRDGKVPTTLASTDANSETFKAGLNQGAPSILIYKELGTALILPHRTLDLRINLATGYTTFFSEFVEANGLHWRRQGSFTRQPRTLVRRLTEFAASTLASNPYNATTNVSGVADQGVVRLTIGTSDVPEGAPTHWTHHVDQFEVKTRNGILP